MIPRSPYIAVICLALAGALHAAIAVLPTGQPERIAVQGGGGASISTLGDSFADMAEGASVPEPETTTHAEPTETPPLPVAETPDTEAPIETPAPEIQTMAALVPPQESAAPAPDTAQPVEQMPALSPDRVDRIEGEAETHAPEESARPEARPDRPKPQPKRKATKQPAPPPQKSGNANRNARAGDASGKETAPKQQAGPSQSAATQSGNAAAENYPGQVMRRIQQTRRERVTARGSVQLSFTIAANGGLAAVNIARSSGSERLDQVAVQQIKRAAPFPPPPAGARRDFTLRIDGR